MSQRTSKNSAKREGNVAGNKGRSVFNKDRLKDKSPKLIAPSPDKKDIDGDTNQSLEDNIDAGQEASNSIENVENKTPREKEIIENALQDPTTMKSPRSIGSKKSMVSKNIGSVRGPKVTRPRRGATGDHVEGGSRSNFEENNEVDDLNSQNDGGTVVDDDKSVALRGGQFGRRGRGKRERGARGESKNDTGKDSDDQLPDSKTDRKTSKNTYNEIGLSHKDDNSEKGRDSRKDLSEKNSVQHGSTIDMDLDDKKNDNKNRTNTQSFFQAKGKGKFEDIEKERKYRLKKIKQLHEPIDYKKQKQHEVSFQAEMLTQKEKKKEELRKRVAELENSYTVKYKSKAYDSIEKGYVNDRKKLDLEKVKHLQNRTVAKKYGEKIKELNFPENNDMEKILEQRFPKEGKGQKEWYYGRFGEKIWRDDVNRSANPTQINNRYNQGNDFQRMGNKRRLQGDELEASMEQKRYEEMKVEEDRKIEKERGRSIDYLKDLRVRRSNDPTDIKTYGSIPLRSSLDIKRYINESSGGTIDDRKKDFIMNRIHNFDVLTRRKEERIRLQSDQNTNSTMEDSNCVIGMDGSLIEDYYIESIKAKLNLLEEL